MQSKTTDPAESTSNNLKRHILERAFEETPVWAGRKKIVNPRLRFSQKASRTIDELASD